MRFVSGGRYSARAGLAHARRHTRRVDCRLAGAVVASRHRPLGVIVVVLYTAMTLKHSAVEERRTLAAARASVPVGL
jgi:hypothetical protein